MTVSVYIQKKKRNPFNSDKTNAYDRTMQLKKKPMAKVRQNDEYELSREQRFIIFCFVSENQSLY